MVSNSRNKFHQTTYEPFAGAQYLWAGICIKCKPYRTKILTVNRLVAGGGATGASSSAEFPTPDSKSTTLKRLDGFAGVTEIVGVDDTISVTEIGAAASSFGGGVGTLEPAHLKNFIKRSSPCRSDLFSLTFCCLRFSSSSFPPASF